MGALALGAQSLARIELDVDSGSASEEGGSLPNLGDFAFSRRSVESERLVFVLELGDWACRRDGGHVTWYNSDGVLGGTDSDAFPRWVEGIWVNTKVGVGSFVDFAVEFDDSSNWIIDGSVPFWDVGAIVWVCANRWLCPWSFWSAGRNLAPSLSLSARWRVSVE